MPTESQYDYIMRTHELYFPRRRRELAQLSGVSLDTLNKVFQRQTKNPKARTVQAIYDVLRAQEPKSESSEPLPAASEPVLV